MPLHQSYPLDLLLEEAEGAAAARAPLVVSRQSQPGTIENLKHPGLVDAGILEGQANDKAFACLDE